MSGEDKGFDTMHGELADDTAINHSQNHPGRIMEGKTMAAALDCLSQPMILPPNNSAFKAAANLFPFHR